VWLAQGRNDRAEAELRGLLAEDPGSAGAHALLSLTLLALERPIEAEDEARAAIGAGPELMLAHYALAAALVSRGMLEEAQQAIAQTLRLSPRDPDAWALQAQIHLGRRAWEPARLAAERALGTDAEHIGAKNVRALALVQLGRQADADATLADALAREPENATTHASRGWSLLQRGAVGEARQHFLEALRLEPDQEAARAGLLESIKARNRFYRAMLAFQFWLGRQQKRTVWVVLLGLWIVPRILRGLARQYPAVTPLVLPIVAAFAIFAFSTWIIGPLSDAFLFFHPIGRHALNEREKTGSAAVIGCIVGAVLFVTAGIAFGSATLVLGGLALLPFIIPLSATFELDNPRRRRHAALIATGLACIAVAAGLAFLLGGARGAPVAATLAVLYLLGVFASSWLTNSWHLSSRTD
jgi:tetratricopeptide (TPR) repeat protein